MNDTNAPTAPRRVLAAQRRQAALFARMGGKTYAQIADELGISIERASQLVEEALKAIKQETAEQAAKLKEIELARLDRLLAAIWPQTMKGDVQAIDRALKIMKRRAELLGLDAPIKQDFTSDGKVIEFVIKAASVPDGVPPETTGSE